MHISYLPFAFASHFAPTYLLPALQLYQDNFQSSPALTEPYSLACVNVVAADTDEEANYIATSFFQLAMGIIHGTTKPLPPPVRDMDLIWSEPERAAILQMMKYTFIGSPETIKQKLQRFLNETQINEIMVTSHIYEHAARLHSYEILARMWEND